MTKEEGGDAQRMDTMGYLASGVVHDFNNVLTVIIGNAELALTDFASPAILHSSLRKIHDAARRASALANQLLAFVRQQVVEPKVFDMNEIVDEAMSLLRGLIGDQNQVVWRPGHKAGKIRMIPAQFDQIMINLCINARDAIKAPGHIVLETGLAHYDEIPRMRSPDAMAGDYAWFSVADNGCGMDSEIQKKIFDPFFTTKGGGRGTGLGLVAVRDIVRQYNGVIQVQSAAGAGTTMRIYIPLHTAAEDEGNGAENGVPIFGRAVVSVAGNTSPDAEVMCPESSVSEGDEAN